MGAGKLRVLTGRGGITAGVAVGVAVLAAACGHVSASSASPAAEQASGAATPTVTPSPALVLGPLTLGAFPATQDGLRALAVCEQWAVLRGQYVARVSTDSPYELEQWFSSPVWRPAFTANSPLRVDPAYGHVSTAFGVATTGQAASITSARFLDQACTAAD